MIACSSCYMAVTGAVLYVSGEIGGSIHSRFPIVQNWRRVTKRDVLACCVHFGWLPHLSSPRFVGH